MTIEILIVFVIIGVVILLFITEWLSMDVIAFGTMVTLLLTGVITPQQGVMGFSNQATITILSLMLIGVGLEQSGAINQMGLRLRGMLQKGQTTTTFFLMIIAAFISAFISSTAVVIVFLRILVDQAKNMQFSLSKILMPLSFAAILGGSCSLMGTSTNLLVNGIAKDLGVETFGLFEFSHIGFVIFLLALLYMIFIGSRLLPSRKDANEELTNAYKIKEYIAAVKILPDSPLIGKTVDGSFFNEKEDIDLVSIKHAQGQQRFGAQSEVFAEGDKLVVKGSLDEIKRIYLLEGIEFRDQQNVEDEDLNTNDYLLCEAMIRPNSRLIGRELSKLELRQNYGALVLAIQQSNKTSRININRQKPEAGDVLLLQVKKANFPRLYTSSDFIVLSQHTKLNRKTDRRYLAMAILVGVILLASFSILPIMISALTGAFAMALTGCFNFQEAYRKVDWSIIFLLAGMIPLGSAMSNTGADIYLASTFAQLLGESSTTVYLAGFFGFTCLMSGFISNNATAILIAPIAISVATGLNLDPKPFLLIVMFAANMSFFTPIGYQTNVLIFGPGNYKFRDFIITGGILTILVWIVSVLMIDWWYF
jgi:di/tricarboxylate transporter